MELVKKMKWVKRIFKNLGLSIAMVFAILSASYIVDFSILNISLNSVARFYAGQITTQVDEISKDILKTPSIIDVDLSHDEEPTLIVKFNKFVDESNLKSITIDKITYDEYYYQYIDDVFTIYVIHPYSFSEQETSVDVVINSFMVNEKEIRVNESIRIFKGIDYNVLALKKKSIVKIVIEEDSFLSTSTSFGSGVIFRKSLSQTKIFGSQAYDYYILTNYHVLSSHIKNNTFSGKINIHYDKLDNTYPKGFDPKISVVGWYTKDTDLAIIKLTTTDGSLQTLEDEQFITKKPVPIRDGEVVFVIGSPQSGRSTNFNQVKEGIILHTTNQVYLENESFLCQSGCEAIQTNAFLGPGSSGGGAFNSNGDLIGIHFAGDIDRGTSSEIPMYKVLEAIDYILNEKEVELFYEVPLFIFKPYNLSL